MRPSQPHGTDTAGTAVITGTAVIAGTADGFRYFAYFEQPHGRRVSTRTSSMTGP
jgi:hypothetical protein